MKNIIRIVVIIACFSAKEQLHGQPVLTFFLRPYITPPSEEHSDKLVKKLAKPGHIARKGRMMRDHSIVKGIFSTYGGFLTMSDSLGQTTFPLKHSLPMVYIIVTTKITPFMMAGNTIHHWQIEERSRAKMYKIERQHIYPEDIYYWQVNEVPVPEDRILPPESITIFAKPKNIIVYEGITITDNTPNLLLPDMFVRLSSEKDMNALYVLNLKHFFGHIHPVVKRDVTRYFTHIED